jgi:hypothetical protein
MLTLGMHTLYVLIFVIVRAALLSPSLSSLTWLSKIKFTLKADMFGADFYLFLVV